MQWGLLTYRYKNEHGPLLLWVNTHRAFDNSLHLVPLPIAAATNGETESSGEREEGQATQMGGEVRSEPNRDRSEEASPGDTTVNPTKGGEEGGGAARSQPVETQQQGREKEEAEVEGLEDNRPLRRSMLITWQEVEGSINLKFHN